MSKIISSLTLNHFRLSKLALHSCDSWQEDAIRDQLRRERDRDIEMVITRLEEETASSMQESEKQVNWINMFCLRVDCIIMG
jgi:hypothetical protein